MRLQIVVDEDTYTLEVPTEMLDQAGELFDKMDHDMDQGWQMSREFVEHPDQTQRCQIVADKLLTSMMNGNKTTALMMAAYILRRMPGVTGVDMDTGGEMQNTKIIF